MQLKIFNEFYIMDLIYSDINILSVTSMSAAVQIF